MRLVLAAGDGLNAISCDRLLARIFEVRVREAPEVTIDLTQAAFIDPYGAACLALIARQLVHRGQRLICVLPASEKGQEAINNLGLVSLLRPLAECRNLPPAAHRRPGEGLLPLSAVRSKADVQGILAYLLGLARRQLGFGEGDVLDAGKVVSELCNNVVDHSQGEGLAVARIYRDRQQRRFVALAVVDDGVGIRASLATRHPEAAGWQHGQAIDRALGGLSSRARGGGTGLRSVHELVRRYSGRLSIRSGNERLYLASERQARTMNGAPFPGTQVSISFSQRP